MKTTTFILMRDDADGTRSVSDAFCLSGNRSFRDMNRCAKHAVERGFSNFQEWLDARGTDRIIRRESLS